MTFEHVWRSVIFLSFMPKFFGDNIFMWPADVRKEEEEEKNLVVI